MNVSLPKWCPSINGKILAEPMNKLIQVWFAKEQIRRLPEANYIKAQIEAKFHKISVILFEDYKLSSFSDMQILLSSQKEHIYHKYFSSFSKRRNILACQCIIILLS